MYKPEFSESHPVIRYFWEVFHDLSDETKRKFLFFLTGSNRVPITGMRSIQVKGLLFRTAVSIIFVIY